MKSTSTFQSDGRQTTVAAAGSAVRWKDLPHPRLQAEIRLAVLTRTPEEAPREAEMRELEDDLPKLDTEDHRKYVTLTIGEMQRELRIWKGHYWDYLDNLNRAPRAIKRRIGSELAVAPVAAICLAQRGAKYLTNSHVDPSVFNLIFIPQNLVCIHLDGTKCVGHPETSIEDMMTRLVPQNGFRKLGHEQGFMAGGPFAIPPVPRPELMMLHELNQVWISSLCRMWDEVLCEVMTQHFLIDLDERVSAFLVAESLTGFQKVAGMLYLDFVERYGTPLPNYVWKQLAETLDQKSVPLNDNLAKGGRIALKDAILQCRCDLTTWVEAITYEKQLDQPAPKKVRDDGRVIYTGDLARHAKKAIHSAAEAVLKVRKR
jgi:hypothetical protein